MEKYIPFIKKILWFLLLAALICLGVFLLFKVIFFILPVVIGLIFALLIDPIVRLLHEKAKFNRRIAALLVVVICLLIFGGILTVLGIGIFAEIKSVSQQLPQMYSSMSNAISSFTNNIKSLYEWLPSDISSGLVSILANFSSTLIDFLKNIFNATLSTAISIPQAIVFVTVVLMSTYFISSDKERIFGVFKKIIPTKALERVTAVKQDLSSSLIGYIKAQLIIMAIIFCEVTIGFSIVGIKQPLFFALLIAILDQVPYIGVMTFLIPMSIYSFTTGNIRTGISILIIYAIIWTVRQITDPKILGHNIGVHPLLTLIGLYVGLQVFGFLGLIIGPFLMVMARTVFLLFFGEKLKEDPPPKSEEV